MLFPCYSFLFILIEAIKTVVEDPSYDRKERNNIISIFLNNWIQWPSWLADVLSPPQVLFSSVSHTKAGQKRILCCGYLLTVKTHRFSPIENMSYLHPWMKYWMNSVCLLVFIYISVCFKISYIDVWVEWRAIRPCHWSNWFILWNFQPTRTMFLFV